MKKRSIILFLLLVLCFCAAISRLHHRHQAEGMKQLETALRRTAVSCYASEGFYPPDVAYMQRNYGLRFDESSYIVHYQLIASNWMPVITVQERMP